MVAQTPAERKDEARARHGIKFDGTINLGHIVTLVGLIGLGISTYTTLDKRITRMEDLAPVIQSASEATNKRTQDTLAAMSNDLREVKGSVDKLSIQVQVQNGIANRGIVK